MKGTVKAAIISAYSSSHFSSPIVSSVSEMLDKGCFTVYFILTFFFNIEKYLSVSLGTIYPLCSIQRQKARQGYFKELQTKIQWGSGNEESPTLFSSRVMKLHYKLYKAWRMRSELNVSQKYCSPGWYFRLRDSQSKTSWEWGAGELSKTFNPPLSLLSYHCCDIPEIVLRHCVLINFSLCGAVQGGRSLLQSQLIYLCFLGFFLCGFH